MDNISVHSVSIGSLLFLKAYLPWMVVAYICIRALYRRYVSALRHIPRPFIALCTRAWKGRGASFFCFASAFQGNSS